MNASLVTLTEKVSKMEAASEQEAGALGDLSARLVAQVKGSAAGWKEALASVRTQLFVWLEVLWLSKERSFEL